MGDLDGGAQRLVAVRADELSLDEVFRAVGDPASGGTALFVGTVRDHDNGAAVTALGYTAHPTAKPSSAASRRRSSRTTRYAPSPPCTA